MLRRLRPGAASLMRRHSALASDMVAPLAVIVAVSVYGWHLYSDNDSSLRAASDASHLAANPVSIALVPTEGARTARAALIAYSDFQCPFCQRFAVETLPRLRSTYVATGRLLLAFRHLPLAIHDHAAEAALVAVCANDQGRFWEMHDFLFHSNVASDDFRRAAAGTLHLRADTFDECLSGRIGDAKDIVARDVASAHALGIASTPTFLVGTVVSPGDRVEVHAIIKGARPWKDFAGPIDALLK